MRTLFTICVLAFALFAGERAMAQGFQDEPTCFSWEGGHKSSGSFSKCAPAWVMPAKTAAPKPAPAVVAAPVMQSVVCPSPEPKTKPIVKRRPAPKKC